MMIRCDYREEEEEEEGAHGEEMEMLPRIGELEGRMMIDGRRILRAYPVIGRDAVN